MNFNPLKIFKYVKKAYQLGSDFSTEGFILRSCPDERVKVFKVSRACLQINL